MLVYRANTFSLERCDELVILVELPQSAALALSVAVKFKREIVGRKMPFVFDHNIKLSKNPKSQLSAIIYTLFDLICQHWYVKLFKALQDLYCGGIIYEENSCNTSLYACLRSDVRARLDIGKRRRGKGNFFRFIRL